MNDSLVCGHLQTNTFYFDESCQQPGSREDSVGWSVISVHHFDPGLNISQTSTRWIIMKFSTDTYDPHRIIHWIDSILYADS